MLRGILAATGFALLTTGLAFALFVIKLVPRRREAWAEAISLRYSRIACRIAGLRIHTIGQPSPGRPVLVVANHVSWADVLAITATAPAIFVAKREVAQWPLIGLVARLRGTVFVDRQRRRQSAEASIDIAERLRSGAMIVLFGEGTSADGNRVLPFRSSLLGAVNHALEEIGVSHLHVQPLAIAFSGIHGLPMGRRHRPVAAWYGDTDLVPHVRTFLRRGPIDVVLVWGTPVALASGQDRKTLTRNVQAEVRQLLGEVLTGRRRV